MPHRISETDRETNYPLKLRPLGPLERYLSAWHHLGFYLNAAVTAYYTSPALKTPQTSVSLEKTIFHALSHMILNQPALSSIPIGEDTPTPHFARLPSIDPDQVVKFVKRKCPVLGKDFICSDDVELDELLEEQHNTPFKDTTMPFWRLIILFSPSTDSRYRFTAAFVFHHALADGASGLIFHQEFLQALNSSPPILPETTIIKTPDSPLLPEMEKLIDLKLSLLFLAKAFWADRFSPRHRGLWTGSCIQEPSHRNFRSRSFTPEATGRFIAICRANKTTVQAALQVLIASSLFKILPEQFTRLRCVVPVSLRRWCGQLAEGNQMTTCISSTEEMYVRKAGGEGRGCCWDEARRSRDNVQEYLRRKGRDDGAGLFKYISDCLKFSSARIGKERGSSFELSNLGRFGNGESQLEALDEEKWDVGRVVFGQSASVISAAILVTVVTGGDGGMTLGFAWQEGVVENAVVETLMGSL